MPLRIAPPRTAKSAFALPAIIPVPPSRRPHCSCTGRIAPTCVSRSDFSVAVYLVTDRRTTPGLTMEQIVESALRGDGSGKRVTFVQYVYLPRFANSHPTHAWCPH